MCRSCHSALLGHAPRQPLNSLANFQYYGYERLPDDIREAFSTASIYDLMLVSRARASQVTHFYTYKRSSSGTYLWSAEDSSQRYNKGNIAIRPQNSTELYTLLPPSPDELQEAMCVIFSGQKQQPSRDTVKKMGPVLVTKSRVRKLIQFLIENNAWYQYSGVAYSQVNMDTLFDEVDVNSDTSLPSALSICHLPTDTQVPIDEGFSSRDAHEDDGSQVAVAAIVMEPIGYTTGDHSVQSREKMKLHALAYVLDRSKFVADNDPGLMSYLFPHLDPWDIGGFYHMAKNQRPKTVDDSGQEGRTNSATFTSINQVSTRECWL
ncbi:hypothetical protein C8R48DRAFT_750839 [Suillus tomentosus]|nr:hypothetical protein C8R48DRAFT_750839 [Suillus tomentosus]